MPNVNRALSRAAIPIVGERLPEPVLKLTNG
jgi:hypothetical protein